MARMLLKVVGMHCPKCDARVEKAVRALAGVESVRANHELDEVRLDYDGEPETLAVVRDAIEKEGFSVEE